jgi:hypothetical protein
MSAEGSGEFDPHMTQAADADNTDLAPGANLPVPQRRPHGDSRTKERRDGGQAVFREVEFEDKPFANDDGFAVATLGVIPGDAVRSVVGPCSAVLTVGFKARSAVAALKTAVHHRSHSDNFPHLEALRVRSQ